MSHTRPIQTLILAGLLAVLPLLLVGAAHAQTDPLPEPPLIATPPLFGAMPELTPVAAPAGAQAIPLCTGPNPKWNAPQFFDGFSPTLGHVTIAWCELTDGQFAGWVRTRPPGDPSVNAPLVFNSDTRPRQAPPATILYAVMPGTSGDKSRPAYATIGGVLGKANGQRAAGGIACACEMAKVVNGSSTYCAFAPSPSPISVALCKPATTLKEAAAAAPSARALDLLREPLMMGH